MTLLPTPVTETPIMSVEVTIEPTRNPDTVGFQVNRSLVPPGTGLSFPSAESAQNHPLAHALFQIRGVVSVWILGNEVTVTKDERVGWSRIHSRVIETLKQILA